MLTNVGEDRNFCDDWKAEYFFLSLTMIRMIPIVGTFWSFPHPVLQTRPDLIFPTLKFSEFTEVWPTTAQCGENICRFTTRILYFCNSLTYATKKKKEYNKILSRNAMMTYIPIKRRCNTKSANAPPPEPKSYAERRLINTILVRKALTFATSTPVRTSELSQIREIVDCFDSALSRRKLPYLISIYGPMSTLFHDPMIHFIL